MGVHGWYEAGFTVACSSLVVHYKKPEGTMAQRQDCITDIYAITINDVLMTECDNSGI